MLYVVGTGGWAHRAEQLAASLDGIPTTTPRHTVGAGTDRCVVIATVPETTGPSPLRCADSGGAALFVDGCSTALPPQPTPDDDIDIDRCWDGLLRDVHGQFVAVRLDRGTGRLEIVNDLLGFRQAYYTRTPDGWLVSNSVRALVALRNDPTLDERGASLLLALSWTGGDSTLAREVRALPAASRWSWSNGAIERHRRESLAGLVAGGPGGKDGTRALRTALTDACVAVGANYRWVRSGLTGGRDSRVLLSLLQEGRVDAEFYTSGDLQSHEVKLSEGLARLAGVRHRVVDKSPQQVLSQWDEAAARLIASTDGMVSLWHAADVISTDLPREGSVLNVWGVGGEIGRARFCSPRWYTMRKTPSAVVAYLCNKLLREKDDLLRPDGLAVAHRHLESFVDEATEEGIDLADVPNAFFIAESIRRKAGTHLRKAPVGTDLYAPFVCRPFVAASFALRPQMRYAEALHARLLEPDRPLYDYPFEKEPWRVQVPWLVLAQRSWRKSIAPRLRRQGPGPAAHDQRAVLRQKLPDLRAECLDSPSAHIWHFVDRSRFEAVTAPGVQRPERTDHLVYLTATVHAWEKYALDATRR